MSRPGLSSKAKDSLKEIVAKHGFVNVAQWLACHAEELGSIAGVEFASAIDLGNYSYGEPLDDNGENDPVEDEPKPADDSDPLAARVRDYLKRAKQ